MREGGGVVVRAPMQASALTAAWKNAAGQEGHGVGMSLGARKSPAFLQNSPHYLSRKMVRGGAGDLQDMQERGESAAHDDEVGTGALKKQAETTGQTDKQSDVGKDPRKDGGEEEELVTKVAGIPFWMTDTPVKRRPQEEMRTGDEHKEDSAQRSFSLFEVRIHERSSAPTQSSELRRLFSTPRRSPGLRTQESDRYP
eukprot:765790-Hanusia_phi.AAC.4